MDIIFHGGIYHENDRSDGTDGHIQNQSVRQTERSKLLADAQILHTAFLGLTKSRIQRPCTHSKQKRIFQFENQLADLHIFPAADYHQPKQNTDCGDCQSDQQASPHPCQSTGSLLPDLKAHQHSREIWNQFADPLCQLQTDHVDLTNDTGKIPHLRTDRVQRTSQHECHYQKLRSIGLYERSKEIPWDDLKDLIQYVGGNISADIVLNGSNRIKP